MTDCATCGSLSMRETASQKYGWEENDTHLPPAVGELRLVHELEPGSSRSDRILQCPSCQSLFRYESDYEYLVNGSEDDQTLTRITAEEADRLVRGG